MKKNYQHNEMVRALSGNYLKSLLAQHIYWPILETCMCKLSIMQSCNLNAKLTAVGGDTKGLLDTSKLSKLDINRSSTGKDAIRFKLTFNLASFMYVNSGKNLF